MDDIKIGLIGGSGLGQSLGELGQGQRHELHTPFGRPSDAIVETSLDGVPLLLLSRHGPGHLLNPSAVNFRANIFALKQLGCTHIIASGAVGSLGEEFRPRDLVIADQVIDKTIHRPATFYEHAAVHVEMAEPFCPILRRILLDAAAEEVRAGGGEGGHAFHVHNGGCYVCMEGPAFSSRAESVMHRLWGGDLIGMTAMPEAKLAKEAEIPYALVALVTDYDSWHAKPAPKDGEPVQHQDASVLLQEIIGNLNAATANAVRVIRRAIRLMVDRKAELALCPAREALKLAIWSDKRRVPENEVRRLAPLWLKYFQPAGEAAQAEEAAEAVEEAVAPRNNGTIESQSERAEESAGAEPAQPEAAAEESTGAEGEEDAVEAPPAPPQEKP